MKLFDSFAATRDGDAAVARTVRESLSFRGAANNAPDIWDICKVMRHRNGHAPADVLMTRDDRDRTRPDSADIRGPIGCDDADVHAVDGQYSSGRQRQAVRREGFEKHTADGAGREQHDDGMPCRRHDRLRKFFDIRGWRKVVRVDANDVSLIRQEIG